MYGARPFYRAGTEAHPYTHAFRLCLASRVAKANSIAFAHFPSITAQHHPHLQLGILQGKTLFRKFLSPLLCPHNDSAKAHIQFP